MANFTLSTGNVAVPSASATVTNGDTSSTIKVTASCYLTDGWVQSTGVVARIYINGSLVATKTILGNGTSYSATTKKSVSASKAITKTTSAQSIAWKVEFWQYTDGVAQSKKETLSGTASVTAKTKYTVTYNANGGSSTPSSQTKWYGTALTLASAISRTGYTFQGWATSSGGGVAYKAGASYTANASVTLYAVWKANTYTITYNANNGSGAPASQTKTHGVTLVLSKVIPTRANYTFLGWSTSSSATSATYAAGANFTSNANTTLYAVWKLSYVKPKITSLSVDRCNSSKTLTDTGTYVLVGFNWTTSVANPTITIQWKLSTATSYPTANEVTITGTGSSGTVSQLIGSGALSADSTYTIYIKVADTTSYSEVTRALSGQKFTIDKLNGGNGIAFGKPAELDDTMDVGFLGRFRNDVMIGQKAGYLDGNQGVYLDSEGFIHLQRSSEQGYHPYLAFFIDSATDPDGTIRLNSTDKMLEFINAVGYRFDNDAYFNNDSHIQIANTSGVYRNMITWNASNNVHFAAGAYDNNEGTCYYNGNAVAIRSKNDITLTAVSASTSAFRPYYRAGDTVDISTIYIGGFVSGSSANVQFFIPLSKPIIGSPTVSIASTGGLIIRQDGKYTHGSAASTTVYPDSYSTGIRQGGVNVIARFTTITNAVNNAPCGIAWTGTITFG